ncbi:glycosyltransferase family 4 protein [Latilactobacillus curvatus]|uniref:glycosyltransferase family 4 protein n=1 Tax=Latilactobacillus curvatus TaxID=28038 RepID=UPI0020C7F388|nr:glycosyltransferase family 4 protein [Latilactobacillus curvatus]MCP8850480.1 glycosyltransferase family 4 protein [Latilactobacillus curvatus]
MRILYGITASNWGGAQEYVFQLIKYETKLGNEIGIFIGEEGELSYRLKKVSGVKVYIVPELQREINLFTDLKAIKKIKKVCLDFQPDIIHLNSSKAGAIGRLVARILKIKPIVIYTAHGWAFTDGVSKKKALVYKVFEKILARLTDKIFCVSQHDYDIARKANIFVNKEQGKVIYNGSDFVTSEHDETETQDDIPRILMVARFDKQKNQALLIESLNLVKTKYKLYFIGDGPTREYCEKMVERFGLSDKVVFAGFQKDVQSFLRNSDLFCLITNYEGLPISIIEAMAMRLPVIASNVGGNKELVTEKNGALVENNKEKISLEIEKLLNSKELRLKMGGESYLMYKKQFTLDKMLLSVDKSYTELIGGKNGI